MSYSHSNQDKKMTLRNSTTCHWECYLTPTAWSMRLIFLGDVENSKRNRSWPSKFLQLHYFLCYYFLCKKVRKYGFNTRHWDCYQTPTAESISLIFRGYIKINLWNRSWNFELFNFITFWVTIIRILGINISKFYSRIKCL